MEWKWSNYKPYERSRRLKHLEEIENKEFCKELESAAYTSSLNHDENTWEILNQNNSNLDLKMVNKREELDSKISDRSLVQQIGFNPFLGETNYLNDVSNRDKFLKPISTTSRTKENSN